MAAMEFHRFEELLCSGAESISIPIDGDQADLLYRYFQELRRWSKKINLISKNMGDEQIVENHFIDSVALLKVVDTAGGRLLDIGSGAGFPGLVCKAVRPDLPVALVEPRLKRVSFLKHIIRLLALDDIDVYARRLEEGVDLPDESACTWVVCRAVTDVGDFLRLCDRFKRYRTAVVCMKGPRYLEEFDEKQESANGWKLETVLTYRLPRSGAERNLLAFKGIEAASQ